MTHSKLKIDGNNFHGGTVANWYRCEIPESKPDYISFSGSAYWILKEKVIRLSNHWGQLKNSRWYLDGKVVNHLSCGECYYVDFRRY